MATYQTIIPISRKVWPAISLPYSAPCKGVKKYPEEGSPAFPASETREYEPRIVTITKWDPTKGTNRKWNEIKRSGVISMTPYSHRREVVENFLYMRLRDFASWKWNAVACNGIVTQQFGPEEGHTRYHEVSDIHSWTSTHSVGDGTADAVRSFNTDVEKAISTTQQAAFANAMSTFDLLTELAEARETLSFLTSKVGGAADLLAKFASTDEEAYKRGRRMNARALLRSSDKALRRLGGRWLEYRYAILPLIYSIKDVNELLAKRDSVYRTERDRATVTGSHSDEFDGSERTFLALNCDLSAKVTSVVKLGYDRGALQRVVAQTAFNPFKTGWELVPLSFVVDWFLNVGDAIASATSVNLSSQTACCTSVKRTEVYEYVLYDRTVDRSSRSDAAWNTLPARDFYYEYKRNQAVTLQRRRVESYERFLFTRPKPAIHFDPHLNWKRMLDGVALSYQPIKKLLRSL